MALSDISLRAPAPDKLREDAGAKSVSFFCLKRPVRIDKSTIADLKALSAERGGRNVRICLHSGPESNHHDMVILERAGKYYRPHKHADKGEAFHLIEGRLGVFAFDERGAVIDAAVLSPGDIYRAEVGMYHAVLPLSESVIYHENKPGPFTGEGDSLYPDWAPDGSDATAVAAYVAVLRKHFDE